MSKWIRTEHGGCVDLEGSHIGIGSADYDYAVIATLPNEADAILYKGSKECAEAWMQQLKVWLDVFAPPPEWADPGDYQDPQNEEDLPM